MKNISTELDFGSCDDIFMNYDKVKEEINYINTLENEVFEDKSNNGRFKAELLKRGVIIKGFITGETKNERNLSKLISIFKFANFNEKYCFKMAREIKMPYNTLLGIAFEENIPNEEDYKKIDNYFELRENNNG